MVSCLNLFFVQKKGRKRQQRRHTSLLLLIEAVSLAVGPVQSEMTGSSEHTPVFFPLFFYGVVEARQRITIQYDLCTGGFFFVVFCFIFSAISIISVGCRWRLLCRQTDMVLTAGRRRCAEWTAEFFAAFFSLSQMFVFFTFSE